MLSRAARVLLDVQDTRSNTDNYILTKANRDCPRIMIGWRPSLALECQKLHCGNAHLIARIGITRAWIVRCPSICAIGPSAQLKSNTLLKQDALVTYNLKWPPHSRRSCPRWWLAPQGLCTWHDPRSSLLQQRGWSHRRWHAWHAWPAWPAWQHFPKSTPIS